MKKQIEKADWKWFGHAGHFICARWCRFHLSTQVGTFLVSTVGELWSERSTREIHAQVHDPQWLIRNQHLKGDDFDAAYMERFGFEKLGTWGTYETMVFKAGAPCTAEGCNCGLPALADAGELGGLRYDSAGAATEGHIKFCESAARGEVKVDA